jgi:hypothetical protein
MIQQMYGILRYLNKGPVLEVKIIYSECEISCEIRYQ